MSHALLSWRWHLRSRSGTYFAALTAYEVTRDSLVYFGTDTVRYLYMHGRLRKEPVMHRRGAYIMRPIAVSLRLLASTTLLLVSAYIMVTATLPVGDVAAQTIATHEAIIIREGPPPPEVIVRQPPPPPREEVRISPPSQVDVWVPGYWSWSTNEWVWVQGRWQRPPERRATWVPGQWTQRGEQGELWAWRPGHWE